MAKTFTLKIRLGNDAMQNGDDVAEVLGKLANGLPLVWEMGGATLFDTNGNTVGEWRVSK